MTLKICSEDNGTIYTDKGIFYIESLYYVEDIIIRDTDGDIFFIEDIRRETAGNMAWITAE